MTSFSVVLITKNQAWNIGRLIRSVLAELEASKSPSEVLLVDSTSTDATVENARQYPIGIIRLAPDQRLTPAAGRYVGSHHTSGDMILFLDGDMELRPGWLMRAQREMESDPKLAALTGDVFDIPSPDYAPPESESGTQQASLRYIPRVGGAAVYRRSALDQVGNFNPYLHSDEEPELCIRLRHAGYLIGSIETPMAYHYSTPSEALSTVVARRNRRLYFGAGQNLRYLLGTEVFSQYVRERGYGLVPGAGLLAGLLTLAASIVRRRWRPVISWLTALILFVSADAIRKRSLSRSLTSLVQRIFIVEGTIRGFLMEPLTPEAVPLRFDVVQPIPIAVKESPEMKATAP